jgi:hypothetical protein
VELTKDWRAADVFLRGERIYVVSTKLHGDPGSFPRGSTKRPPFMALDAAASDSELGAAVVAAVNAASWAEETQGDIPAPTEADDPLLRLAGVDSYRQFRRGLRASIHVWEEDADFRLTYLGSQPFYAPTFSVRAKDPNPERLGEVVRDALAQIEARQPGRLASASVFAQFLFLVVAPLALLPALVIGLVLFLIFR